MTFTPSGIIQVYEVGSTTVVGFGGRDILDNVNLSDFREQMTELVAQHDCRVLAFDLTGVRFIPSGLLGLLASLRRLSVEVQVYNPSEDVREAFAVTNLDQVIKVREVAVAVPVPAAECI